MSGKSPENVLPYNREEGKTSQIRRMFDSIAGHYDLMNTAMSFGLHRHWRDVALRMIQAGDRPRKILDVATGTGDVAIRLHEIFPDAGITGIDLSEGMLEVARRKIAELKIEDHVEFRIADCLELPFADDSFDAVTVAYGVRNFEHLDSGYREMLRVLRPGGRLCVVELSQPANPLLRIGYKIYAGGIIPVVGKIVSGDTRAYRYLPESIARCPARGEMTALMESVGFRDARYRSLTFGAVCIYSARKPQRDDEMHNGVISR